ncbi:hypothetical protein CL689_06295 [Candidatus Saccharibacteria bacterium]|nr:hypothetical protein [Candidatus Saccharibacteria bacterium]|tara:strand:+ start:172 stop:714 length:543 start_codon:yes stop_codon:yes gene_type:complete
MLFPTRIHLKARVSKININTLLSSAALNDKKSIMEFKTIKMPAAGALDIKCCIAKLEYACRTDDVVIKLEPLLKDQNAVLVFGHKGPQIWIDWIESNRRGAGAEALSKLTLAADAENAILRCYVDGDIGGGLFKFYERFGFVRDPAGGEIMERPPLPSPGPIKSVNSKQWFGDVKIPDNS